MMIHRSSKALLIAALACLLVSCGRTESGDQDSESAAIRDSGAEVGVDAAECYGPGGLYVASKDINYHPCCPGLREVFYLASAQNGQGVNICWGPPMRVYACVQGRCGDGVCEVGEAEPCGCVADCPSAVWGDVPTGELDPGPSAVAAAVADAGTPPR
jgi:hypothetical protein